MELRQLRYFVAVARQGSFSKAATDIFVAQSALSYQICRLEAEVGSELFHRLPRGVRLTEAGRTFLPHALSVLKQTEVAKASVASALGKPVGKVTFGLPPSLCGVLALPLLMAVRTELPGVELELTEELTTSLATQLRDGSIDLAVLFDDGTLGQFAAQALLSEEMFLVSRIEANVGDESSTIEFKDAIALPQLLPASKQGVRPIIEALARIRGLPPPNVVGEINSVTILRSTLVAGIGHTMITSMAVKQDVDAGLLKLTRIKDPTFHRHLALCALRQTNLTGAAAAVSKLALKITDQLVMDGHWSGGVRVNDSLLV